ncbi:uncharacterized protein N7477_001933 [Penicillium maclennaniae]|uniref:uncharacterized protein n=1 Tax=Penicillium maclennaniae TaxID=1343394 RepID=UPI00253FAB4E|nr:uncharacterized protein N7477_001933 [Penicillium maclennaniae]KAJ5681993.1 hypothetical protein N7477_001933 [Penicillium maclennaniae]
MVRQDPHQGGSLSDMAPSGTTIPNDAGKMNTIPSVLAPTNAPNTLASTTMALPNHHAPLPQTMPLTCRAQPTGEVVTGTGNTIPASIESKRAYMGSNIPGGDGDTRDIKHHNHNRSAFDRYAKEDENAGEFIGEHQERNA